MRKKGFTLIELLVVLAIIALLMGILMPSLVAARQIGRRLVCLSNLRQMVIAANSYLANNYTIVVVYYYTEDKQNKSWVVP